MNVQDQVSEINQSPYHVYVVTAGGGQSFFQHFMKFGGASKTIVGGNIPYSKMAFDDFCGSEVDKYVSVETAELLATQAYKKACQYGTEPINAIGISATCSLATVNERSGRENKAYLCFHNYNFTIRVDLQFNTHTCDRDNQEKLINDCIIDTLYDIVTTTVHNDWTFGECPSLDQVRPMYRQPSTVKYTSRYCSVTFTHCSYSAFTKPLREIDHLQKLVIYPGSWNPLHDGHKEIKAIAEEVLQQPVHYELSVNNADKGSLSWFEVQKRFAQTDGMLISHAPRFIDKVNFFAKEGRQLIFVCGADTWNRIWDTKYLVDVDTLYQTFVDKNVKFLVCGRDNLPIFCGEKIDDLIIRDSRAQNHSSPISSTEIRKSLIDN